MVFYKKIFFVVLLFGLLFICTPVFAGNQNTTQPWSLDSYSPTFDTTYTAYARSMKFVIFPDAVIIFPRDKNVETSSCFVKLEGHVLKLSDNSSFFVIPIATKTTGFPTSYKYLNFSGASSVTSYTFSVDWEDISFSSVNIYGNSFSTSNLRKHGVGIFLGSANNTDTTVDWFSRYANLQGVFEDNNTLYYLESKNVSSSLVTTITLTAYTTNTQVVLWTSYLSTWSYDNSNGLYYINLPSDVISSINSNTYQNFQLTASHTVNNRVHTRTTTIYATETGGGGSGGGDDPGGGESGGSFDDTEILNSISDVNDSVQSVDNSIQEQTDFLTNSNISDSSFTLPSDSTQDITQDGINNIFTLIYNGFTSGTAPDIVLPVPFTNKTIIIPANYTYNILNGNQAFSVIYALIQAFYWYFISVFIVSDISRKITKIKSGNLENIANSNIKEEML